MKATVIVTLKPTVLDPQGMTIHRNLESLGLGAITDVRQGKHFAVSLAGNVSPERAKEQVERLAREVLTNPVIEQYRIFWE
jgi:phosphoribosylformylglycinamidine synthase